MSSSRVPGGESSHSSEEEEFERERQHLVLLANRPPASTSKTKHGNPPKRQRSSSLRKMLSSIKKRLSTRSKSSTPTSPGSSSGSGGNSPPLVGILKSGTFGPADFPENGFSLQSDGTGSKVTKKARTTPAAISTAGAHLKDFRKSLSNSLASALDLDRSSDVNFGTGQTSSLPNTPRLKSYMKRLTEDDDDSNWNEQSATLKPSKSMLENGSNASLVDSEEMSHTCPRPCASKKESESELSSELGRETETGTREMNGESELAPTPSLSESTSTEETETGVGVSHHAPSYDDSVHGPPPPYDHGTGTANEHGNVDEGEHSLQEEESQDLSTITAAFTVVEHQHEHDDSAPASTTSKCHTNSIRVQETESEEFQQATTVIDDSSESIVLIGAHVTADTPEGDSNGEIPYKDIQDCERDREGAISLDTDNVSAEESHTWTAHKLDCPINEVNPSSNCVIQEAICVSPTSFNEENINPGIKPEFYEWQFWNNTLHCDYGVGVVNSEVLAQKHTHAHAHGGQARVLTDYNDNECNYGTNEEVNLDQDHEQQQQLSTCLYYLTPCVECSKSRSKSSNNPIRLTTTTIVNASNSSSSASVSASASCSHSRELIQIVDILLPEPDNTSDSEMGNQSGKESKGGGSGGKSSKHLLKRGDTKNALESSSTTMNNANANVQSSNIIIGPNSIVVQKLPSKKLAPPPPPPAYPHSQNSASQVQQQPPTATRNNNEKRPAPPAPTINVNNVNAANVNAAHEREPSLDYDPSSGSSDLLGDSYLTAANGYSAATGSYYSALGNFSPSQQDDGGDDDTLMNQSDQLSIDSVELIMPSIAESNGNLNNEDDEGQVFQTSATAATVTANASDANCNGPQRPMTTSFTLTRKRKVELSAVSSPVDEIPPAGPIGGRKDTTASEQNLAGDDSSYSQGSPSRQYGRFNSVSDVPLESNVLRKVASLVLAEQQTAGLKQNVSKPKFVPEKLDFKIYEKFEGQMLINWFVSSFNDGHYLKETLTMQDLKYLATQYCTLLLAAGVLKQIEEAETTPLDSIFRPDLMYYWSHSESPAISTQVPGKLPPVSWPPANDTSSSAPRNGAKYTEAGEANQGASTNTTVSDCGSRTLSPEHLPEPGTVPKTVSHFESECDLTRISATTSPTADGNGPEFQQMMMGLKREHKEILEKKVAQHEVDVFSARGETAELMDKKYASRIEELEKEVETLRTLLSIQNLTNKVEADFGTAPAAPTPPPPPPPMAGMPPPPPPPMAGMPPPPPPPMGGMPPPPPPMGGPPPPPGMPSLGGPLPPPMKIELRKKPVQPKVPMKPLYWTRIQITTPSTRLVTEAEDPKFSVEREDKEKKVEPKLWEKLDEVPVGNWEDFTQLFSKQVVEKKETPENSQSEDDIKKASKKPRQQTLSLLDQKRAQNLLIFVKSNKLEDISKIKSIIYNLELGDLKLETLEKILASKASDEEYTLIKDQMDSNSDIALDPADRYLYDLHSIPKFADRVTCFIFQFTFYESLSSIEMKLNNFQLVCEKLVSSKDLQKLLALILTYGNYMNGGNTTRGQADGFSLDILPQLRDVKSKENSFTFLHFIVSTYVQMYDEFKGTTEAKLPTPEPSDIESAASIDFDAIQKDLNVLKKDLEDCEKRTEIVINSSTEENLEPFKTKMTEFLEQAKGKVQNIEETYEEGQRMYLSTMKFFDFNPNKKVAGKQIICPPADFFTNWLRFCNDFKEIWKSEQQKILKEKIRESERFIQQKQSTFSKYFTKAPKKKGGLKDKLAQKMGK